MTCLIASSFPSVVCLKSRALGVLPGPRRPIQSARYGQPRSRNDLCSSVTRNPQLRVVCEALKQPAGFFDRDRERAELVKLLLAVPSGVTILLGPKSCGKSALLANHVETGQGTNICLVDCRPAAAYNPDGFTNALLESIPPSLTDTFLEALLEAVEKAGITLTEKFGDMSVAAKVGAVLRAAVEKKPATGALGLAIDAYTRFLGRVPKDQRPVIIIDEANILLKWRDSFENELESMIDFFLCITKQRSLAHVILATSDLFFLLWFQKQVEPVEVQTFVIGEMSVADGRALFERELGKGITNKDWDQIFEVCGGNPGMLVACARRGADSPGLPVTQPSWDTVLESLWVGTRTVVENGLKPDPEAKYTGRQYAVVVLSILEAPSHAVLVAEIEAQLGGDPEGARVLEELVKNNLVTFRPYSPWAIDIPLEVFGPRRRPVVTAPTSVHLFCMKMMEPEFRLAAEKEEQPVPLEQAVSSSPPVQEVEAKIEKLEAKIEKLEAKIEKLEAKIEQTEVKVVKGDGWQLELHSLRQREARLGENLKQLREKEKQLREQLLLLLRGTAQ